MIYIIANNGSNNNILRFGQFDNEVDLEEYLKEDLHELYRKYSEFAFFTVRFSKVMENFVYDLMNETIDVGRDAIVYDFCSKNLNKDDMETNYWFVDTDDFDSSDDLAHQVAILLGHPQIVL